MLPAIVKCVGQHLRYSSCGHIAPMIVAVPLKGIVIAKLVARENQCVHVHVHANVQHGVKLRNIRLTAYGAE